MKKFIFFTHDGSTFQPISESDISDIENCQIIGWADGVTPQNAFDNLKKENSYLSSTCFDTVIGSELVNCDNYYFSLKC